MKNRRAQQRDNDAIGNRDGTNRRSAQPEDQSIPIRRQRSVEVGDVAIQYFALTQPPRNIQFAAKIDDRIRPLSPSVGQHDREDTNTAQWRCVRLHFQPGSVPGIASESGYVGNEAHNGRRRRYGCGSNRNVARSHAVGQVFNLSIHDLFLGQVENLSLAAPK